MSAAKPAANYLFTTLAPNLGVVSIAMVSSFLWLIFQELAEGAHEASKV
ncbi:MAG: hypothetical protein IPF58_10400 [Saprospirales bacterium]|nr:hypothetical protein [Saprospirales bacterium]